MVIVLFADRPLNASCPPCPVLFRKQTLKKFLAKANSFIIYGHPTVLWMNGCCRCLEVCLHRTTYSGMVVDQHCWWSSSRNCLQLLFSLTTLPLYAENPLTKGLPMIMLCICTKGKVSVGICHHNFHPPWVYAYVFTIWCNLSKVLQCPQLKVQLVLWTSCSVSRDLPFKIKLLHGLSLDATVPALFHGAIEHMLNCGYWSSWILLHSRLLRESDLRACFGFCMHRYAEDCITKDRDCTWTTFMRGRLLLQAWFYISPSTFLIFRYWWRLILHNTAN